MIFLFSLIHILSSDQILTTNIGQDVTFSCVFQNESQLDQISFLHQTTGDLLSVGLELFIDEIYLNNHMKLIHSSSSNRLDLKIYSVNLNDSGLYTCMFNDGILSSYLLEIFIPPRFTSFFPLEASISYLEGSSINFSCHADAYPPVNITWIYRNKNKQFKTIHNGESVFISSVKSSDSGSYECIASNGYHVTISRLFYVTVQYPPRVTINKFLDIHARPIYLYCQICSIPLSNIEWIKNGKNLPNQQYIINKKDLISNENNECIITRLTIQDILNEKYGRYECRGENFLGHHSDHIDFHSKLAPQPKSGNEQITFSSLRNYTSEISSNSSSTICCFNTYLLLILILLNILISF